MAAPYSTGTVTVTNGSASVVGNDTGWVTALVTGGVLYIEALGNPMPIASVEGEEALTAAVQWKGGTGTYNYAIVRESSDAASMVAVYDQLRRATITLSLHSLHPNFIGTLTEIEALELTPEDTEFVALRMEESQPVEWYRWLGTEWSDPFPFTIPGSDGIDGVQSSDSSVTDIIALTQAEYDLLDPPDASTFYIIKPDA